MESSVINSSQVIATSRWDYEYNQQSYVQFEQSLLGTETSSLQDLCKYPITKGETPLWRGDKYVSEDEGVLFIRSENIREQGLDLSTKTFITNVVHQRMSRSQVKPKDVLLAIVGATIGQVAVVPSEIAEANCNQAVAIIRLNDDINPNYVQAILRSSIGQTQIRRFSGGSARPNLDLWEVRLLRIPLFSSELQNRIADTMQEAYVVRKKKLEDAYKLLAEIDAIIFSKLNIFPENVKEETRFVKSISALRGRRLDVAFNMGFHKFDPYKEQVKPIGEVVSFPKETKDPTKDPNKSFRYIDISSINIETGEIEATQEILGLEAPSRARQVVHASDIIISTVRPTRGATAIIPAEMDGYICSTGFTIVRPQHGVSSEYLHAALRLNSTREQFGRRSAGSSYPAILEKDVKVTLIPWPLKDIQEEITNEISSRKVESRRLRIEADNALTEAKRQVEQIILGRELV